MTTEQEAIMKELETIVNEGVVEAVYDLRQAIEGDTVEDEGSQDTSTDTS